MKYIIASFLLASVALGSLPAKATIPDDVSQPSLFFTQEEMEKIYQANDGLVNVGDAPGDTEPTAPVDPGPRVLKLTGILYHSDNDWVIWFNDTRISPKKLPDRMLDVLVRKDRIALKWLDRGTNKIINLVLRPQQEYHIDTDTITLGTER